MAPSPFFVTASSPHSPAGSNFVSQDPYAAHQKTPDIHFGVLENYLTRSRAIHAAQAHCNQAPLAAEERASSPEDQGVGSGSSGFRGSGMSTSPSHSRSPRRSASPPLLDEAAQSSPGCSSNSAADLGLGSAAVGNQLREKTTANQFSGGGQQLSDSHWNSPRIPCASREEFVCLLAEDFCGMLNGLLISMQSARNYVSEPISVGTPVLFVNKWIDYTNKYGFGCQLTDGTLAVNFLDGSTLCVKDFTIFQYIQKDYMSLAILKRLREGVDGGNRGYSSGQSQNCYPLVWFADECPPRGTEEKMRIMALFSQYMSENLVKGCDTEGLCNGDVVMPYLIYWKRFEDSLLMVLSDGTFQINFFESHVKVVLKRMDQGGERAAHPEFQLTYVDESRRSQTFRIFSRAHQHHAQARKIGDGSMGVALNSVVVILLRKLQEGGRCYC